MTASSCAFVIATALIGTISVASAAEKDLTDKGEALLRENCSRCHAIGKEGVSPHKDAPPFRTLSQSYPVGDLAESLAEGIVAGHPDMPIFVFSARCRRHHHLSSIGADAAQALIHRAFRPHKPVAGSFNLTGLEMLDFTIHERRHERRP